MVVLGWELHLLWSVSVERVVERVGRIRGELEGVRWKGQVVLTGGGGSEVEDEEGKAG